MIKTVTTSKPWKSLNLKLFGQQSVDDVRGAPVFVKNLLKHSDIAGQSKMGDNADAFPLRSVSLGHHRLTRGSDKTNIMG